MKNETNKVYRITNKYGKDFGEYTIRGNLLHPDTLKTLVRYKDIHINGGRNKDDNLPLLVNLNNTQLIGAQGVGCLINIHNELRNSESELKIYGLSELVYKILYDITNVNKVLSIHDNRENAINSINGTY